jgi:hypothetical protein
MVARGDLDDAGPWLRLKVRFHFMMCRHCARFTSQLRALGEKARAGFKIPDDPDTVEKLKKEILDSL